MYKMHVFHSLEVFDGFASNQSEKKCKEAIALSSYDYITIKKLNVMSKIATNRK